MITDRTTEEFVHIYLFLIELRIASHLLLFFNN